MNKSPINHLLTTVVGAVLWIIFAILLGNYFSASPSLASKFPQDLAAELRMIFGLAVLLSIGFASYWYYYGSQDKVAGELPKAKNKWQMLFFFQIIIAVALTFVIVLLNRNEGIESEWYIIYFGVLCILTFLLFWITTYLLSPRNVKYIPFGK